MTRVAVPSLERFLAQATEFRGKGKFCGRFHQKRGNFETEKVYKSKCFPSQFSSKRRYPAKVEVAPEVCKLLKAGEDFFGEDFFWRGFFFERIGK